MSAFNTFSSTESSRSTLIRKGRQPKIGVTEIRSICTFAASLRRSYKGHEELSKALDEQILCEAWLWRPQAPRGLHLRLICSFKTHYVCVYVYLLLVINGLQDLLKPIQDVYIYLLIV